MSAKCQKQTFAAQITGSRCACVRSDTSDPSERSRSRQFPAAPRIPSSTKNKGSRKTARPVPSTPEAAPSATKPRRLRRRRKPHRPVHKSPNRRTRTALLFGRDRPNVGLDRDHERDSQRRLPVRWRPICRERTLARCRQLPLRPMPANARAFCWIHRGRPFRFQAETQR